MKKFISKILTLVLISILLCTGLIACDTNTPTPEKKYEKEESTYSTISNNLLVNSKAIVKWEGRYEYTTDISQQVSSATGSAVLLYFTATGFTISFKGTSLKVKFLHSGSDIYYNYAIDDETLPNANANRRFYLPDAEQVKEVTLAEGLTQGEHTITCLKMDEAADAYTAISSFETDGHFMYRNSEEDNSKLKFMIVCASGGSGHGSLFYCENETTSTSTGRTRANSSSLHSFNYLTARMFNADVQFVAQSGWGVRCVNNKSIYDVLDYSGITPDNNVTSAQSTAKWSWANYVPDVVILNIGGNDTSASTFVESTYKEYCIKIVQKIHEHYPNAKLIWTHTGSKAGMYATQAFDTLPQLKEYLHMCIIPQKGYGITGYGTYGANDHNSMKTHIDTAEVLATYLRNLGYSSVRNNITFDSQSSFVIKG